jgi:hypothetical protein
MTLKFIQTICEMIINKAKDLLGFINGELFEN